MRISSVVIGACHLVIGGALAYAVSRFGEIYTDLLSADAALPTLTRIVLALTPDGWIVVGVLSAALLISKDLVPSLRKIPNWPFVVALLLVGMGGVIALFLPLMGIIREIGTT